MREHLAPAPREDGLVSLVNEREGEQGGVVGMGGEEEAWGGG